MLICRTITKSSKLWYILDMYCCAVFDFLYKSIYNKTFSLYQWAKTNVFASVFMIAAVISENHHRSSKMAYASLGQVVYRVRFLLSVGRVCFFACRIIRRE